MKIKTIKKTEHYKTGRKNETKKRWLPTLPDWSIAELWLTVYCETKWSETKQNETKWNETK